jgi:hypothetical protein
MIAYIRYDKSSKEIIAISQLPFDGAIMVDMDDEFEKVFNNPTVFMFSDNLIVQKDL